MNLEINKNDCKKNELSDLIKLISLLNKFVIDKLIF